ncbi:esterase [Symbiobacterium thermophilum IAM 14863]|uniref:Esterase n=2 Tax=Symbiobacterium thermophilum TaxID=2734 RepID=Q67MR3_SYMTH|nr:esterase [Symbiobacterium thermophilum IAM 14863]
MSRKSRNCRNPPRSGDAQQRPRERSGSGMSTTPLQVLPGAEPLYSVGSRIGVLVSHGFTGSPQSMRFLAEGFARAGYTVAMPRLTGHGTTPAEMAASTASDWTADIVAAMRWLEERCDVLFMTGLSMGGALTVWAAGQFPERFAGIMPINAALRMESPDLAALAFNPDAPAELPGIGSDIKAEGVKELAYPVTPVPAIKHLITIGAVAEMLLPRVKCPALIIQSREDHVVPPHNGELIYNGIGSTEKELLWLENSYHVATLDNDKELILERSLAFIRKHS